MNGLYLHKIKTNASGAKQGSTSAVLQKCMKVPACLSVGVQSVFVSSNQFHAVGCWFFVVATRKDKTAKGIDRSR
eukprot:6221817-Amphidinium_carterae.1